MRHSILLRPKRLAEKLQIHYTPKHGSWRNMAEKGFEQRLDRELGGYIEDEIGLLIRLSAVHRAALRLA
jgi:hypothetical protein